MPEASFFGGNDRNLMAKGLPLTLNELEEKLPITSKDLHSNSWTQVKHRTMVDNSFVFCTWPQGTL